jgi:hypothetical protein
MTYSLSQYLTSINQSKKNIMLGDSNAERCYPAFIINKCLAGHIDAVLYANQLNINNHLDNRLQYDFLINTLKPRKRFSPWVKNQTLEDLEIVKEYYGYNRDKALEALKILNKDQIQDIKRRLYKGGSK